jgi:hypothetical protein
VGLIEHVAVSAMCECLMFGEIFTVEGIPRKHTGGIDCNEEVKAGCVLESLSTKEERDVAHLLRHVLGYVMNE